MNKDEEANRQLNAAQDRLEATGVTRSIQNWMNDELWERGTHPQFICSVLFSLAARCTGALVITGISEKNRAAFCEDAANELVLHLRAELGRQPETLQ